MPQDGSSQTVRTAHPFAVAPTEADESVKPVGPGTVPVDASQEKGSAAAGGPVAGASGARARIVLRARADIWIEITGGRTNKHFYAKLLRAGQSYTVPDRPGLKLLVGNAGGLEVLVDGTPLPPLGPAGVVRRNVRLEPRNLSAASARGP